MCEYIRSTSWVMNGTREENSSLPIYQNCLSIVGHATLDQLRTQTQTQAQHNEQPGNHHSSHFLLFNLKLLTLTLHTQTKKAPLLAVEGNLKLKVKTQKTNAGERERKAVLMLRSTWLIVE